MHQHVFSEIPLCAGFGTPLAQLSALIFAAVCLLAVAFFTNAWVRRKSKRVSLVNLGFALLASGIAAALQS
jgi:hypothetical protein